MTSLEQHAADYLQIRRALGFKLERAEKLLAQYLAFLDATGQDRVTIENALAWTHLPGHTSASWWAFKLSTVRCFATYLHAIDPAHEVPPADVLPRQIRRAVPYLYTDEEIWALMTATSRLRGQLRQATYRILIGLLAVTGMRVGEAIRLDRPDFDPTAGMLTVRGTKFGKSRELPLHPTTVVVLRDYLRIRDAHQHADVSDALLISPAGTRLIYCNVHATFRQLRADTGLESRSPACRPRIHDLRHRFAVQTLLDWYRDGVEIQPRLPLLSTYLGHTHPRHTYWYLQAAPELLAIAGQLLETAQEAWS
ncbi:MAG TPA: tyrosine-type recombinase/integrase [Polyangiales bacterium]|nr:tyrosine-type recombinase/integrase [Polyangiales bacterium]